MLLEPNVPLDIHLQLAKKIKDEFYTALYGRYNYQRFQRVLEFIYINIADYYPRDDELIQLLLKLITRKSRMKFEDIARVLSLLDDDYNRYPDNIYNYYRQIYYK